MTAKSSSPTCSIVDFEDSLVRTQELAKRVCDFFDVLRLELEALFDPVDSFDQLVEPVGRRVSLDRVEGMASEALILRRHPPSGSVQLLLCLEEEAPERLLLLEDAHERPIVVALACRRFEQRDVGHGEEQTRYPAVFPANHARVDLERPAVRHGELTLHLRDRRLRREHVLEHLVGAEEERQSVALTKSEEAAQVLAFDLRRVEKAIAGLRHSG